MSRKFENLKITFSLKNSVSMQKGEGAFDSILALLYFNECKRKGTFSGDYTQELPFLGKSNGVYHTSFPVFNGVQYFDKEVIIKTFDHDIYAKYGTIVSARGKERGNVNTTQGPQKNAFFSLERIGVDKIVYYVKGDMDTIAALLENIRFLGKKSSLGWGEIKSTEIEVIKKDFSLVKYGVLMRNIPIENDLGILSEKIGLFRLQHPYWKKTDLVDCYMP